MDMADAALLAMPDQSGGSLWHPASLRDFDDLPDRVLTLYLALRDGQAARSRPWDWHVVEAPNLQVGHQYAVTFTGKAEPPARCGFLPPEGAVLLRRDTKPYCPRCSGIEEGRGDVAGWGEIGGTQVAQA